MSSITHQSQRFEKAIMALPCIDSNVDVQAQISNGGHKLLTHFGAENDDDAINSTVKFRDWLDECKVKYYMSTPRALDVDIETLTAALMGADVYPMTPGVQHVAGFNGKTLQPSFKCDVLDHTTDEHYMTTVSTPGEALDFVMEASRLSWDHPQHKRPSYDETARIMAVHTTSLPTGGWSITVVASYEGTTQVYTAILTE